MVVNTPSCTPSRLPHTADHTVVAVCRALRYSNYMPDKHRYRYRVVDVFTRVPLEGNPLAVFPDSRGIDSDMMQRIARELNLSETVFIEPPKVADCAFALRIFTPTREMLFAGHPTVGGSFVAMDEEIVAESSDRFGVEEKIGPVPIRVERGDPPMIWLTTPPITFEKSYDPVLCADALGLDDHDLLTVSPQIVSAGNPMLFVPVKDKPEVDRARLNQDAFSKLKSAEESFCLFIFAPTSEGAYSRMFAPDHGIVEDPATGSATGPLAAFMKKHDLLPIGHRKRFVSEQGTKMGRRSLLYFEFSSEGVSVGGYVTPLVEAVMTI
jgi:trans-2,3-dihydro-3-hydroxyanthranilate isomerase